MSAQPERDTLTAREGRRIRDGIVSVKHGQSSGTGFFVLPGLIATCEHVLDEDEESLPGVEWGGRELEVTAVTRPGSPGRPDLALIAVVETDHPLLPLAATQMTLAGFYSFGFQYTDRGYDGYSVTGRVGGIAVDTGAGSDQQLLVLTQANIHGGLSGAPVFSLADRAVVGVVKRSNPDGGGYAIPIEMLEVLRAGTIAANTRAGGEIFSNTRLDRYMQDLESEHSFVSLADLRRDVRLDQIYVTLTLAPESVTGEMMSLNVGTRFAASDEGAEELSAYRDLGRPQQLYRQPVVPFRELLSCQTATVLGEPGAGKTTLLRHLVLLVCRGELFPGQIPVFIKLSTVAWKPGAIRKYLTDTYGDLSGVLESAGQEGRAVFFLDGLDEVPRSSHQALLGEVVRLASRGNRIFVSCRTAAYPKGLLPSAFRVFSCLGFTRSQQRRFLRQWFLAAPELGLELERQIGDSVTVARFASNPLMISLVATLFENEPQFRIPTRRVELYRRLVDVLLKRRDDTLAPLAVSRYGRIRFLRHLGFQLMTTAREVVSEEDLLDMISAFQDSPPGREVSSVSAEDLLHVLVERDGMLVRSAEDAYRFVHLTFQEYFAAMALAGRKDAMTVVAENSADPRWEEVVRLYASTLDADGAVTFFNLIAQQEAISPDRMFFLARCMADASAIPDEAVYRLADELLAVCFPGDLSVVVPDAMLALASLAATRDTVVDRVEAWIANQWRDNVPVQVYFSFIEFLGLVRTDTSVERLLGMLAQVGSAPADAERVPDGFDEETWILLTVTLLTSLGNVGKSVTGRVLLPYVSSRYSSAAGTAARALAGLRGDDLDGDLLELATSGTRQARILAAPLAARSLDTGIVRTLLTRSFCDHADGVVQLALRNAVEPEWLGGDDGDEDFTVGLLRQCRVGKGILLSMTSLMASIANVDRLAETAFDNSVPVRVRVGALETILRLDAARAPGIVTHFLDRDDELLLRAVLAVLATTGNRHAHEILLERVGPGAPQWLLAACVRLFSAVSSRQTQNWLVRCLADSSVPDPVRLRMVTAAAVTGHGVVLTLIDEYLNARSGNAAMRRAVAYQALAAVKSDHATAMLIEHLEREADLNLISVGIDALGDVTNKRATDFLLRVLSPDRWPGGWPPPQPPLRRGEQRPAERRLLAVIFSLNRLGCAEALAPLSELSGNDHESAEVRGAAYAAVRTIAWATAHSLAAQRI